MNHKSNRFLLLSLLLVGGIIALTWMGTMPVRADQLSLQSANTPTPAPVATSTPESPHGAESNCMMCHSNPNFHGIFKDGDSVSLTVDTSELKKSVHAEAGLTCEACHSNISAYPHTEKEQVTCTTCHPQMGGGEETQYAALTVKMPYEDKRAMVLDINEKCYTCHEEENKNTEGSAHKKVFESGNTEAPMCVDCHGGHDTIKPGTPRTVIVDICGKCHESVYTSYKVSVHGETLYKDPINADVPTCISCHGVHSVRGPREVTFRGDSIEICGKCHANEPLMARYDVSTHVFDTYLNDFHGRTVSLFQEAGKTSSNKATCYDCHGIHNIRRPEDPLSSVNSANLQHTCQQCHKNASSTFTQAWLSHTEISWEKTPLLFAVRSAYAWFLIPATIGGFIIYIALDARRRWMDKRSAVMDVLSEESVDEYDFEK